jgi:hypothetical protein
MGANLRCSHIPDRRFAFASQFDYPASVGPRTLFLEQGLHQPDTIRIIITREMEPSIEIADRWHTRTP